LSSSDALFPPILSPLSWTFVELNTAIANAIEKSKLGEAGFDEHDIFSFPALEERIRSDDTLSPICDNSNDACDPHTESISFKIPMKIVERAMNNCYLGDRTVHPGDHLLFILELCELFKCVMTHKYRGCIVVLSINKSVEPNEEQKVLMSSFNQGITVNTSKQVFRGIW
jgi:hypothetical protein